MSAEDLLCARRPPCVCCEPAAGTPGTPFSGDPASPLASRAPQRLPPDPASRVWRREPTPSLHEAALVLGRLGPGCAAPRQGSQRHPVPSTASPGGPPGRPPGRRAGEARLTYHRGAVEHRPARGTLAAVTSAASVRRRKPPVPIATAATTRWPPGPQNLTPAGTSARVGPRAQRPPRRVPEPRRPEDPGPRWRGLIGSSPLGRGGGPGEGCCAQLLFLLLPPLIQLLTEKGGSAAALCHALTVIYLKRIKLQLPAIRFA